MVVIADTRLIERRLETARSRGGPPQASAGGPAPMPDWAADALVALGMTRAEIAAADAANAAELDPRERDVADTDAAIDALEDELMGREERSPATLHALAELALARLRRSAPTDPNDVFYDAGEARAVALLEQVVVGLAQLRDDGWRRTG
jgi:hypothetical protein